MTLLAGAAALCWLLLIALPWQPWRIRERIEADRGEADLSDVRVLIPARNEAALIEGTVTSVLAQDDGISVVVIDDESTDGTGEAARRLGEQVQVISGQPRPSGWSGKLWALEQGHRVAPRRFTLLLDADIRLAPGMVAALRQRLLEQGGGGVSVMASLSMNTFWERLLLPAFIYFFRLLYPFSLVNRRGSRVAAAAGGCILLPTALIDELALFRRIRGELIDDCALAREVKASGRPLWLGLSHGVSSHRAAESLGSLAGMVRRTAFIQLGNSTALLALCTVVMLLCFAVPPLALTAGGMAALLGLVAWALMGLSYLPTLRFYRLAPGWAVLLPVIGMLYLLFTWQSAISTWRGTVASWRGRNYATGLQ